MKSTLWPGRAMRAMGRGLLAASALFFCAGQVPAQTADAGTGEVALRKKVAELENSIRRLQEENAALRSQLESAGKKVPAGNTGNGPTASGSEKPAKLLPEGARWISSTGKRHNARCRYYGKGEGHAGKADEGVACKVCGG